MLKAVIKLNRNSVLKYQYIKILLFIIIFNLYVFQNKIVLGETLPNAQKTIKQLVDELKMTKTEEALNAIENELYIRIPKTEEDMNALLGEISHPIAAILQKVIRKTSDITLAPILINKCEEKLVGLRNLKEADFEKMNKAERESELDLRISLEVIIETLGNLKDKRAIPTLKKFLDYTGFIYPASAALSMMGDDDVFAYLLNRMEQQRDISLAGIKSKNLLKIVEEIDNINTSESKRGKLIKQIKGSKDPEVNAILKTLAKNSTNADVRAQAGLALVNSIIADKNAVDVDFVIDWASMETKDEEEDWAKGWVINAMDYTWDVRYIPILINFLQKNRVPSSRGTAARILGERKVLEAVPYLEEARRYDIDGGVRGEARWAIKEITGIEYPFVHPDDIKEMQEIEEYLKSKQPPTAVPNARKQKQ